MTDSGYDLTGPVPPTLEPLVTRVPSDPVRIVKVPPALVARVTPSDTWTNRRTMVLRAWPNDHTIGHLVITDHIRPPSTDDWQGAIDEATRLGYRSVRTGALFPRVLEVAAAFGFEAADTLALLRHPLGPRHMPIAAPSTKAMRRWHMADAARVDVAAFPPSWGNDARSLSEIRHATPTYRARWIPVDGALVAFAITGSAGHIGYLQRLAVDPRHQREGLARGLIEDSLVWMRRRRLTAAMVNTGIDNHAALSLYAGLGFTRMPEDLTIAELELTEGPRHDRGVPDTTNETSTRCATDDPPER